ncbi:flap endonuclease-1 [Candidatus Woesearchaeota archaeon CG_4_10_14_0_2_um_filter_33_10]|nr:MAG: flap endonuclease-1 [Candidatus Woesearchaeota archaeon CG1_02_33_12]PIN79293.1 MAG: flap endonuclease-1 [Candidatus Woesearchaeota archaeon CG10_big_fil_rev_8_21_14_0_10_33_12]PIU72700.1 MAG: flap endonuclease-1 [Candidatus Woesearchaeota archaeon CG06_land_8_20_14_3_00_33_13]PIZ52935.1 MAG: flap endonuclease-1 [Candidatus Woesearchaeota archaeon CG_4_10_14_0_2_um_filter_33_10]
MGTQIKCLLKSNEISLNDLNNKTLVIDSYNLLYQFLTTIRSRDGSLLMDSKGNITSHLVGLFSRTTRLMQSNIKLIFVFDGKPPKLKEIERQRRKDVKIYAEKKYEKAVEEENIEEMKKYASRTTRLTESIIEESKKLISALGLPIVQALSEGEAQAACIVKNKDADYCVSQDFDSLLFGSPKLVRNLSIIGKRKKSGLSYTTVSPELIDLSENLNNLGIDQNQLIALAMLVGTDYNIGGVKGIGPKNALKLVKKHKSNFDALFKEIRWNDFFDYPWEEVYDLFKKIPLNLDYQIKWEKPNKEEVINLLVKEHDFAIERVEPILDKLLKHKENKQQKGLGDFF